MKSDYFESLNSMLTAYGSLIRSSLTFCKRYNRLSSSIKSTIDTWAHPMYVTSYVKLLSLQKKELEELVEKETERMGRGMGEMMEVGEGQKEMEGYRGISRIKKLEEKVEDLMQESENYKSQEKFEFKAEAKDNKREGKSVKLQRKRASKTTTKMEPLPKEQNQNQAIQIEISDSIKLQNETEPNPHKFQPQNDSLIFRKKLRSSKQTVKKDEHQHQPSKKQQNIEYNSIKLNNLQDSLTHPKDEQPQPSTFLGLKSEILPEFLTKRINKHQSESEYICKLSKLNRDYFRGPYKNYTLEEKTHAVETFLKQYDNLTEISKRLGIPAKNIKRWADNGVCPKRGGGRRKKCPEVERQVYAWITQTFAPQDEIQSCWIQEYALRKSKNPQFLASRGWLINFMQRYDLRSHYKIV